MNAEILKYWQQNSFRGDISAKKFARIVRYVRERVPEAELHAIHGVINADYPEGGKHDAWLKKASASEIADWLIAGWD